MIFHLFHSCNCLSLTLACAKIITRKGRKGDGNSLNLPAFLVMCFIVYDNFHQSIRIRNNVHFKNILSAQRFSMNNFFKKNYYLDFMQNMISLAVSTMYLLHRKEEKSMGTLTDLSLRLKSRWQLKARVDR